MNGRDKRKRVKARQLKNSAGLEVLPKKTESANGIFCQQRRSRIDASVCTVLSTRQPHLCGGCSWSGK